MNHTGLSRLTAGNVFHVKQGEPPKRHLVSNVMPNGMTTQVTGSSVQAGMANDHRQMIIGVDVLAIAELPITRAA